MSFLGMRGTGDWVSDARPKSYRETILYLWPNGTAPLTALLSKLPDQKVDDPEFSWWTSNRGSVTGAVTNIYTDAAMANAYVNGGVAGDSLFVKVAASLAGQIRAGHQVLLRDASHYDVDVMAKVADVTVNGANSMISVTLLEDDDNGASTDLSDCDTLLVVGNINAEGAEMPDAVHLDPTKYYNYTQIFRTPLDISRTARRTRLRTGDAYGVMKKEALEQHSIEMELAFLWGIPTEGTGANGKPERTTQGLINFIRTNAAANVNDYSLNATYSADPWTTSGETWLDSYLEQIFRYGANEKMCFAGSGAILGLNRLAKNGGQIQLSPTTKAYGLQVMEWITPFGTIYCKTHPLFSYDATTRNMMVIFEPKNLKYRFIDDTTFRKRDPNEDTGLIDGTKEEYLTEAGLEMHHPLTCGVLSGVGVDNVV